MWIKWRCSLLVAGLVTACLAAPAIAESYPARPVHMVVPFAAGGGADIIARLLAEEMRKDLGVPVLIENRPGASGLIGAEAVARALPDGYTLLFTTNTTHAAAPALFKKLPFDPIRDFRPIAVAARGPFVLLVRQESSLKTPGELVEWMKRNPAQANYAYSNSTSQVAAASFVKSANLPANAVPYKGATAAITDVIGGTAAIEHALALPNIREHFARLGSEPAYMPPQQAKEFVRAQIDIWRAKIRDAHIEPQ